MPKTDSEIDTDTGGSGQQVPALNPERRTGNPELSHPFLQKSSREIQKIG
jgi:hypothetical protein